MSDVIVRFDNAADQGRCLGYGCIPVVPAVGETVNIGGNPFVVTRRGWAVGELIDSAPVNWYGDWPKTPLYAYVDCVPMKPVPASDGQERTGE